MLKPRKFAIGVFALVGATVAVVWLPVVLDIMFEAVKNANGKVPQLSVEVDKHSFSKILFRSTRLKPAEASALQAVTELRAGSVKAEDICKADENATCEDVELSSSALQRPGLKPLTRLAKVGDAAIVNDESPSGTVAVYQLKSIQRTTKNGRVDEGQGGYPGSRQPPILMALALLGAMFGTGIGNLFFRLTEVATAKWNDMETGDRVNLFLGLVTGIIVALPFLITLGNLGPVVAPLATVGLTIGFSAIAIYALNSVADVLPWKKGEVRGRRSGIKVLDTNVLIDGRIYDLARTGFLEGELYVPKFVLLELQHIADSADSMRRQRGRRGLEVLKHIQAEHTVEVGTHDRLAGDAGEEVDTRLVKLAMALGADLVSNDYNLNRVASIQDVRVLNINDLALSLRPNVLPGELLELTILREGSQPGQGVGYLEDGTMVVVENGRNHVGEHLDVTVTQVIQTERGKMIFGSVGDPGESDQKRPTYNRR